MKNHQKFSSQPNWSRNPYIQSPNPTTAPDGSIIKPSFVSNSLSRSQTVDNDKYVKVYTSFISSWLSLSIPAQHLLAYVISIIPVNSDIIYLPVDKISSATSYKSKSQIYKTINELINKHIIAKYTNKSFYFINPNFLFNGNRIEFREQVSRSSRGIADRENILKAMHDRGEGVLSQGEVSGDSMVRAISFSHSKKVIDTIDD